jgi:protein-S-isoprenylcysteine O-methyltransferase Ste14
MNNEWVNWASEAVLYAWIAAGIFVLGSALFTNRIKRRDAPRGRLLDFTLLWGGYFVMFSQAPVLGPLLRHFLPVSRPLEIAGVALAWVGSPLVIWARACLGRYWSGVVALKQDHKLIQSGPYRLIRHPLYTGLILAAAGWCLVVPEWSSLVGALSLTACFVRRARKEDALLATEFGAEFEEYREKTGRLVPRVG